MAVGKSPVKSLSAGSSVRKTPEELVLDDVRLAAFQPSTLFLEFAEKILPRMRLSRTCLDLLEAMTNPDLTAERLSDSLRGNPYCESQFLRLLETLGERGKVTRLDAGLVLYGMQRSRDTLIAMQLFRGVTGRHPEWNTDGTLRLQPSSVLQYALKAEETAAGDKSPRTDLAFAAGLAFDVLALLEQELGGEPSRGSRAFLDRIFNHSLESARLGSRLSRLVREAGYQRYAFSACLLHDLGKVALALLEPKYIALLEQCSRRGIPRPLRHFAEQERFGVDHALLGGVCCQAFPLFEPIEEAIRFHHEPYLLAGGKPGLWQLSSLVCLATNVVADPRKVEQEKDPALGDFPVDLSTIRAALAEVRPRGGELR